MSDWSQVRQTVNRAFSSHFHSVVATVDDAGLPHLTPIGSLMLSGPGEGVFFPIFAGGLAKRLAEKPEFCILAIDGRAGFWVKGLVRGRFKNAVGIRLHGKALNGIRQPSDKEIARWRKRLGPLRWLPGSKRFWSRIPRAMDLRIDRVEPIRIGRYTKASELRWQSTMK